MCSIFYVQIFDDNNFIFNLAMEKSSQTFFYLLAKKKQMRVKEFYDFLVFWWVNICDKVSSVFGILFYLLTTPFFPNTTRWFNFQLIFESAWEFYGKESDFMYQYRFPLVNDWIHRGNSMFCAFHSQCFDSKRWINPLSCINVFITFRVSSNICDQSLPHLWNASIKIPSDKFTQMLRVSFFLLETLFTHVGIQTPSDVINHKLFEWTRSSDIQTQCHGYYVG